MSDNKNEKKYTHEDMVALAKEEVNKHLLKEKTVEFHAAMSPQTKGYEVMCRISFPDVDEGKSFANTLKNLILIYEE